MPTTITTSTAATATAYSNQRKVDRCQNGVLWTMFWDGTSTTTTSMDFYYSTDNGATWTKGGEFGFVGTGTTHTPNGSFFIDLDDYAHVIYKDRHDGYVYYRRGTPNAARTAWTWSARTQVAGSVGSFNTYADHPDIVAHREGTDWRAHIVFSVNGSSTSGSAYYARINITSAGEISLGVTPDFNVWTIGRAVSRSMSGYPSIDFNHTGDGKTVAGGTPHLYAAASAGATGAGEGIRFKKAAYSGGSWTWGTEREIDSTRYVNSSDWWLNCLFDGTRVVIPGYVYDGAAADIVLYERDAEDTTPTTRLLLDNATSDARLYSGSATYDANKNIYLFGLDNASPNPFGLAYHKWDRGTLTLGSRVSIDDSVGSASSGWCSVKRGYSNNRIEFIYTDGNASPYTITYDSILLNKTPNVPTALTVTSDVLDTTPVFSADISDPDSSQQIKGRFQIYQSDGTTLVGTVDSALRTGAGTVSAEYASALPVGNYKVQAATVDDAGLVSNYSAQVSFSIKTTVEEDINYLWKVDVLIVEEITYQWNVLISNQKDITFQWNTFEQAERDIALEWLIKTPWVTVDPDPENNPVLWEKVSP